MTRRADTKIGRLRAAILELLAEHEADDALPTSGRFLFYELEGRGIVSKAPTGARRPDQDMNVALTDLREDGLVPWHWIVDETRSLDITHSANSVRQWMTDVLAQARINPWGDDLEPPMILTESRSLAGVLREIAYRYAVPIASTNGQCGGFLHTGIAPRLTNWQQVIYLGDLDLAGSQIEANTRKVLESYAGTLQWDRLAITAEQVDHYQLPVIVKADRRYADGRPHEAVETEALSQRVLTSMLTAHLDDLLPEPIEDVQLREREQRNQLTSLLGQTS